MDRLLGWIRMAGHRGWQLAGVAVGFLVLWTVFQKLQLLVVTVFVALLLAALLTPLADWLERRGLPRGAATAISLVGSLLVIAGVMTLIVLRFMAQADALMAQFEQVREQVTHWLQRGPLHVSEAQLQSLVDQAVDRLRRSWSAIASRAIGLLAVVGAFLTAVVLAFFLMRDSQQIGDWSLTRMVSDDQQELVAASVGRAIDTLQGYIRATVIIGALDALLIGTALVLLGVPLAVPLGVLTFLGAFFPVVGATVAGGLAALVATVTSGLATGLVVVAVVIVVQQVDGNLLQPVVMGHAVNLHPVVILLVLAGGGLVAGIVGAFMAVPVTAMLAAIGSEVRERRGEQAPRASVADLPEQAGP